MICLTDMLLSWPPCSTSMRHATSRRGRSTYGLHGLMMNAMHSSAQLADSNENTRRQKIKMTERIGLLDLSAAFNIVDHDVLLKRLEISYGVTGVPRQWFNSLNSYLAGRVQTMVINRSRSSAVKLSCGVPQRSVLGPILFVLYTEDVKGVMVSGATATLMRHWSTSTANPMKSTHLLKNVRLVVMSCKLGCGTAGWNWMQTRQSVSGWQTRQWQPPFTVPNLTVEGSIIVPTNSICHLGVFFLLQSGFKTTHI